ncbi:MAG: SIS domain-containing protein [Anaerolineales bacterium]|nr:SIS domain-containing protein [Anaerolineales bacterium]
MSDFQPGKFLYKEITSQPDVWAQIIMLVTEKTSMIQEIFLGIEEVIFAGCGSGLNASMCGAPILQSKTGIPSRAVPAAEIYLFPKSVLIEQRQMLAIFSSRSGATTEVVHAMDYLLNQGIRVLGITCTEDSPLALRSDLALVLSPAEEQAVVTTRSLTGMILTTQLIAAIISGDQHYLHELQSIPDVGEGHMRTFHDLGKLIGQNQQLVKYAFVGNGPYFGQARESQLKVKETVFLPVDAYPVLDFRHGPQSNVDGQMLVTVFISDSAMEEEIHFMRDMKALGGVVWGFCDIADESLKHNTDYLIEVDSGISEHARGILYMPAVQYMAYYRSLSRGINPDEPPNVHYWVDTSG